LEVTVDVRRSDLLRLNLCLFPRLRGNYVFAAVVAAFWREANGHWRCANASTN